MNYAGFWKRFVSYWLDALIMSPLIFLNIYAGNKYQYFQVIYLIPGSILGLWYSVYLVKKYGGTPGKRIMKIRITKVDGTPIEYKEAILRHSVLFVISYLSAIPLIIAAAQMSSSEFISLDWMQRSLILSERSAPWSIIFNILMQVWIWSEFIVLLFNKKRRALHDFIAGTVVIRDNP